MSTILFNEPETKKHQISQSLHNCYNYLCVNDGAEALEFDNTILGALSKVLTFGNTFFLTIKFV